MTSETVSRNESPAAAGLRDLLHRLVTAKVTKWKESSDEFGQSLPDPADIADANIVTSLRRSSKDRHAVVIDIDHPTWLVRSSTEGHFHLYIDVPGGIEDTKYKALLRALADAGVIEMGYEAASLHRGYTAVRLPWIKKESA